jgi:hypothetical protein
METPKRPFHEIWEANSGNYKTGPHRVLQCIAKYVAHRSRRTAPNALI